MRKACELIRCIPVPLVYLNFALLLVLATAPAWQTLLFGLTLDDLLQLRSFNPG
ncbi:MAG: hypothetical protein HY852_07325 [Bradyrhizobium sp.]|uniref:hypothetical protein n=1 Tax=Bradyrhizobium sp. TaxID=376 RepID=UPI0025B7B379|nr:hypothetical protein [Bradyrhizobium sp.]MBI5261613.1 hypothetical protein [Bradyrhizobium sp.]